MTLDEVKARLAMWGITVTTLEDSSITFCMDKTENHILNLTNQDEIPDGLHHIAIDMVCAEFLMLKKSFGLLSDIDFEQVVSSVSEGDTSVSFEAGTTPEQRFDSIMSYLLTGHVEDFIKYRKLVW